MNGLVRWFVRRELKKYVTNASVKEVVHGITADFAKKVKLTGREKVVDVTNDVMTSVSTRIIAFKDDGQIIDGELAQINATDDKVIDKYFSDEQIGRIIDRLLDRQ